MRGQSASWDRSPRVLNVKPQLNGPRGNAPESLSITNPELPFLRNTNLTLMPELKGSQMNIKTNITNEWSILRHGYQDECPFYNLSCFERSNNPKWESLSIINRASAGRIPSLTNATTSPKAPQQFSKRYRSVYLTHNRRLCVVGVSRKPQILQKVPQKSSKTTRRRAP